jgi:hypothetical protein
MSISLWPTPTDSTSTQGNAARSTVTAARVAGASPPSWSRAAIERTNTRWSGRKRSRARSPSSAPPERRLLGSTATIPTPASRASQKEIRP